MKTALKIAGGVLAVVLVIASNLVGLAGILVALYCGYIVLVDYGLFWAVLTVFIGVPLAFAILRFLGIAAGWLLFWLVIFPVMLVVLFPIEMVRAARAARAN